MLVHVFPRINQKHRGIVRIGNLTLPCALGRSGIITQKREGDGATPRGKLRAVAVYFRLDRLPLRHFGLPAKPITKHDGWCDDPRYRRYNRPVQLPSSWSHEALWRDDHLYDIIIETSWNRRPAVRGRGSAIFIHLARPGFLPTEGCIALDRKGIQLLLSHLTINTHIRIH